MCIVYIILVFFFFDNFCVVLIKPFRRPLWIGRLINLNKFYYSNIVILFEIYKQINNNTKIITLPICKTKLFQHSKKKKKKKEMIINY